MRELMYDGWIKLHRILLEKAIWKTSTPEQKTIFITLLLMVFHDTNEWEWNGKKFITKPGQCVTSLEKIAKECGNGVTVQNVRTAIKRFEKYGFLTNESTKTGRLISICNWKEYQIKSESDNKEPNKDLTKRQQTANKELTTTKNDKKNKNYKETNKDIRLFIDYFYNKFKEKTSEKYHVDGGKDGKIVKNLLGTYNIEKLKAFCDYYFNSRDKFILDAGYSIGVFKSVIAKIISQKNKQDDNEPIPSYHIER